MLAAVRYTRKHKNIKAIGIRDEDKTASAAEFIFSYPTDLPPEKEIFSDQSVAQFLFNQYHLNLTDIIRVTKDHHNYSTRISNQCDVDVSTIEVQCIQVYVANQNSDKFAPLISTIKSLC
mgnify:FL=1